MTTIQPKKGSIWRQLYAGTRSGTNSIKMTGCWLGKARQGKAESISKLVNQQLLFYITKALLQCGVQLSKNAPMPSLDLLPLALRQRLIKYAQPAPDDDVRVVGFLP